jgi:hypothetical protein
MALSDATLFSFDSSSLIHAWNRAYRPKNFPTFWVHLEDHIKAGVVVASIEVLNELARKDDGIYAWCKAQSADLCVVLTMTNKSICDTSWAPTRAWLTQLAASPEATLS